MPDYQLTKPAGTPFCKIYRVYPATSRSLIQVSIKINYGFILTQDFVFCQLQYTICANYFQKIF